MVDRIERRLTAALAPATLQVVDESRLHAGHSGAKPGGETHFRVAIVSTAFRGKSRVERQRLVFEALGEEMRDGIHALSITAEDDVSAAR